MNFDWISYFQATGIEYAEGPTLNVRRGHVGIDCPGCLNDTKKHFAIDLEKGTIKGCWRDKSHWLGPTALIATLSKTTFAEAQRILESGEFPVEVSLEALARELETKDVPRTVPRGTAVRWPAEFKPFTSRPSRRERPFHTYLDGRGFDAYEVATEYGLRWVPEGEWKSRVAFPLRLGGRQVGWTARAIGSSRLRYRTEPPGDLVRHLVWNLEPGDEGDLLVLVEGPFDALKLDVYAPRGVTAAAMLGLNSGPSKLATVARCGHGFQRTVLLLDRGTDAQAMDLAASAAVLGIELAWLPNGVKDPGVLEPSQVREVLRKLLTKS